MEGELRKWTNMVRGWQQRYFVLNGDILRYYTTLVPRESLREARGTIPLWRARVTPVKEKRFNITTFSGKTFYMESRNKEERDNWVRALELAIRGGQEQQMVGPSPAAAEGPAVPVQRLEEAGGGGKQQLMRTEPAIKLEKDVQGGPLPSFEKGRIQQLRDERITVQKKTFTHWCNSYLSKVGLEVTDLFADFSDGILLGQLLELVSGEKFVKPGRPPGIRVQKIENIHKSLAFMKSKNIQLENIGAEDIHDGNPKLILGLIWTIILRFTIDRIEIESKSGERKRGKEALMQWCQQKTAGYPHVKVENFTTSWQSGLAFCALMHAHRPDLIDFPALDPQQPVDNLNLAFDVAETKLKIARLLDAEDVNVSRPDEESIITYVSLVYNYFDAAKRLQNIYVPIRPELATYWGEDEDFDEIYRSIGKDGSGGKKLTGAIKETAPVSLLIGKSQLEIFSEMFSKPGAFLIDGQDEEERFFNVLRFYFSSVAAMQGKASGGLPYNPVLGESFRCRYTVPGVEFSGDTTKSGPFPAADKNQVCFLAEQLAHKPIAETAFYAEHPAGKVSFHAHISPERKLKSVHLNGNGQLMLHEYDEEYTLTFPAVMINVLFAPLIELSGKCELKCEKTGYSATVEFLTSWFGRNPNRVAVDVYKHNKKVCSMVGHWNGEIMKTMTGGEQTLFVDARQQIDVEKLCPPVAQQADRESRRVWRHVTAALFHNQLKIASAYKDWLQQKQRDEAKERAEAGQIWVPAHFTKDERGKWSYNHSLEKRLKGDKV